jgi:exodeoxyribonuclease VII large subunit
MYQTSCCFLSTYFQILYTCFMSHPLLDQLTEKVLTVSEYLTVVNDLLSPLRVEVEGEVTDLKILPQWTFFSLKDAEDGSLLRCGMHSQQYRRIGVPLEEGMAVKVFGYGKIAQKSGNFGFWVSKIEPVGEGALRRAYELLVKKLQKEGMFTRKRELPQFISHIGVISSRNGVVLQDLQENLRPLGIRIDFVHSGVEGPDSAAEILRGVEHFTHAKDKPQILVLIRGGGSLESLQGFNNEAVCRALFAAPMPVLVGIGHDVDAPIATMVADWSASTPTAVAHVINDSWAPLTQTMPLLVERMVGGFARRLRALEHGVELASRTARHAIAQLIHRFREYEQILRHAWRRIPARLVAIEREGMLQVHIAAEKLRVRTRALTKQVVEYERLLHASDPEQVLARGYGLVYGPDGRVVRDVDTLSVGDMVKTRLKKGTFESTITKKKY